MRRRLAGLAFVWLALTAATEVPVRFLPRQQPPPADLPRSAQRSGPDDGRDRGPLGALLRQRLATLEVTWWDTRLFTKEPAVRAYLTRLLDNPRGATVNHRPWAQRLPVASLTATVIDTDGRRGQLLVWHHLPSVYAAWLDAKGRWWFAYWLNDPDLRVPD